VLDLDQEPGARAAADYAPFPTHLSLREPKTMKTLSLRCLCLALLVAGLTLTGCAGTRNNAQQADAAPAKQVDMNTPF
jgi:hypothetical protein